MQLLAEQDREHIRPLYTRYFALHGAIDAVLEGGFGRVFADNAARPRSARLVIGDFHVLAGEPDAGALEGIPPGETVCAPEPWYGLLRGAFPVAEPKERFAFTAPERWDRAHLAPLRASLPPGYELRRVAESDVEAFRDLNQTFVDNFESLEDYLRRGIGFAVANERGELVAGCSTYTISSRCLEFEIETRRDHWRRGLALVTGARMIEHCLEAGLEPCWDAAHEGSARLAERLGFVNCRQYTAYRLR